MAVYINTGRILPAVQGTSSSKDGSNSSVHSLALRD